MIVSAGTLELVIVVCAELGEPTVVAGARRDRDDDRRLGSTTLLLRVWTWTVAWVAPAAMVAVVGGVTMSLLPAVPPAVRFMVSALLGAESAVTTKVAGWPWGTWLSTDWIVIPA